MKRWRFFVFICLGLLCCDLHEFAETAPHYDELVHQGNTQLQAGDNDLALGTAHSAIKLNAERWEGYALAGGALMNLKRYEEAADDFSKAIERAPTAKQDGLRNLRKQCLAAELGLTAPGLPLAQPTVSTNQATTQAEVVLWKSIENSTNPADFHSYLDQYPKGAFTVLANRHLADIQDEAEQAHWQAIKNNKNPDDFQSFLKEYPNGKFVGEAQQRLALAQTAFENEQNRAIVTSTWTDPSRGLMWQKVDPGDRFDSVNFVEASQYCATLRLAHFSDWRLPTAVELEQIYQKNTSARWPIGLRRHDETLFWTTTAGDKSGEHVVINSVSCARSSKKDSRRWVSLGGSNAAVCVRTLR